MKDTYYKRRKATDAVVEHINYDFEMCGGDKRYFNLERNFYYYNHNWLKENLILDRIIKECNLSKVSIYWDCSEGWILSCIK